MRFRKRWLSLLLIPVGVLCLPLLFIAMATGTRLLSALTGPINIWNTTRGVPSTDDVAGHYELSGQTSAGLERRGIFVSEHSGFTLYSDHKMEVYDLPAFDGFGRPLDCNYTGKGTWDLYDSSTHITLDMTTDASPAGKNDAHICSIGNAGLMAMLGRNAPFRFWYVIGDPDEDDGLLYKKQ